MAGYNWATGLDKLYQGDLLQVELYKTRGNSSKNCNSLYMVIIQHKMTLSTCQPVSDSDRDAGVEKTKQRM